MKRSYLKIKKITTFLHQCIRSDTSLLHLVLMYAWYLLFHGKRILKHQHVKIKGISNIKSEGLIRIGIGFVGFSGKKDSTILNIRGKLVIEGDYYIGRGCRFDIGDEAVAVIGKGGFINCNNRIVIMHGLQIGDNCIISWDCQFLDENFHSFSYEGQIAEDKQKSIVIGNNVWIGNGVKIYQGAIIPDGCVVAAHSVIRGEFKRQNVLIGGMPAREIKSNVKWK